MLVYVLNILGQPLIPTECCGKVRRLLKSRKAKVVRRCPFTIQLMYETTNIVQPLTLGMDTGSGTLAVSIQNEKHEVLYMSEVEVRNDISTKMDRRREYRRNRRTSKREDRFSPTMVSKLHAYEKEIAFVKKHCH